MNTDTSSHERFRNLASALQSCTVATAILVGGGWTLYTFIATDVEKRAARELFQQAQIDIELEASHHLLENEEHCIAATVAITNTGERNVLLNYSDAPFSVAREAFDANGNSEFKTALTQSNLISTSRVLRSGETVDYPFFVVVKNTGMYVVQFRVPLPSGEMQEHLGVGGPAGKIFWLGSTFVNVTSKADER